LRNLLATMARQQGLTPHVHPGYRTLGRLADSPPRAGGVPAPQGSTPSSGRGPGRRRAKPARPAG
jgi:hypothetical protein